MLLGIAQEKTSVWRFWRSKYQPFAARPQMEWGRQMAFVDHFYWYLWVIRPMDTLVGPAVPDNIP